MAAMQVRNTFVELVAEDNSPMKAISRPWATFNVFGSAAVSDVDTDVDSGSDCPEDVHTNCATTVPEENSSDSDADARGDADAQRMTQIAHENVRLLRENALLRNQPVAIPQPVIGSQWVPMQMQFFTAPVQSVQMIQPAAQVESKSSRRRRQRAKGKGLAAESLEPLASTGAEGRTTVMLRNLPREYSRDMLMDMLNTEGFAAKYDFVYMPIDFVRKASLGYAFVNLISVDVVAEFWRVFDGFKDWAVESQKTCRVSWSEPHQGLEEHVDRYKNSPLMHEDVPDEVRPILLQDGIRIAFPAPTKSLRAPRLRASRQRNPFWNQAAEEHETEEVTNNSFTTFDVYA